VPIDVRLVAATNQPLEQQVEQGSFRKDLFYRINTIEISLPPLRERVDDLPALVEHFMGLYARKYHMEGKTINSGAMAELRSHHWPGNIRELSHAIERALILSDDDELDAGSFQIGRDAENAEEESLNLEDNERRMVNQAIEQARGNISHAAQALGITRAALYRRIEKFGL
jgi:transcriptional regulator with PAS, ATPase and Fis domain